MQELEAGLNDVIDSPKDRGKLEMIVRRPSTGEREILEEGMLDLNEGLVGDNWKTRKSSGNPDAPPNPETQITLINSRLIALIAGKRDRWHLCGDQLFVDLDLSLANLLPGTRLELGSAVLEITAHPHTGCKKFVERFGPDALQFTNNPRGRELNLRGVHAKIIRPGSVKVGNIAEKLKD